MDYSLVVTRNSDFDTEPNSEFLPRASQPLGPAVDGVQTALGHTIGGGGGVSTTARVLYFSDVSPAGTDPYLAALANLGITPTVVPQSSTAAPDTYPQFVTQLSAGRLGPGHLPAALSGSTPAWSRRSSITSAAAAG